MITKARLLLQTYGALDKIIALVKVDNSNEAIVAELRTDDELRILDVAEEDKVNSTRSNLIIVGRFPRVANSRYPTGYYRVWISQTGDDKQEFRILFDDGKPRITFPEAP